MSSVSVSSVARMIANPLNVVQDGHASQCMASWLDVGGMLFLTTCSDDSKPYVSFVALIKGFPNHIGFAII